MSDTTRPTVEAAAMSVEETARFLGMGQSSIWREIREHRLPAVKCGRRTLVTREDAIAFLRHLPRIGAAA
jgi:excisionase family DNA binding protein